MSVRVSARVLVEQKIGFEFCKDRFQPAFMLTSEVNCVMITVNTSEFWCLLKQHVSTHVSHLQAKYM
jgi:hypothetical protein